MALGIEIAVGVVALLTGYIATCLHFKSDEDKKIDFSIFVPFSKSRIFYLIAGVVAFSVLIYMFTTVYVNASILHQIKLLILVAFLLPIAAIDFRIQKIPNKFLIGALIARVGLFAAECIESALNAWESLTSGLIAAVVFILFFALVLLVFKNSIGMGDIKLFAVMGLYQGVWGAVNSIFFSLLASFFFSISLLILKKKKRKDTISFGPCALLGAVLGIGLSGI